MTQDVDLQIRALTDEEVEHFSAHGWAMLRGLVDKQLVRDLLQRAKAIVEAKAIVDLDVAAAAIGLIEVVYVGQADPSFRRFALSSRLGEIAARLLGEPVGMRRFDDRLMVKPTGEMGKATPLHQDYISKPCKCNSMSFWVALDDVTPDMGAVQFFNGSQKLGMLGGYFVSPEFPSLGAAVERFPRLGQCELTEPQEYGPGDATVNHCLTVHCAPANTSDRTRWAYRVTYIPADATFTGEPSVYTDGLDLAPEEQFDHPNFPVVYTP